MKPTKNKPVILLWEIYANNLSESKITRVYAYKTFKSDCCTRYSKTVQSEQSIYLAHCSDWLFIWVKEHILKSLMTRGKWKFISGKLNCSLSFLSGKLFATSVLIVVLVIIIQTGNNHKLVPLILHFVFLFLL